jgi:hypothetical protein
MSKLLDRIHEEGADAEMISDHNIMALIAHAQQLEDALKAIEGGNFDGASNFVIAGDWRGAYGELQKIARAALA